jgi:hypothetical protein
MPDEMREEYESDYATAQPNRFAAGVKERGRLAILEPEVAAAFQDDESLNAALKMLLRLPPPAEGKP